MQTMQSIDNTRGVRYRQIDRIRGITLISMILYHGCWDLVYIYQIPWEWYRSEGAYVWQQSICWTFILLSGFCWSFGRKKWKNGCVTLGASVLISMVTILFLWEDRIVFGVLTFLGAAMLLLIPMEYVLKRIPALWGCLCSGALFFLFRNVNSHFLGFESWNLIALPECWYENYVTAFFGFPQKGFYSTDYFPVLPWLFLFIQGYFLYRLFEHSKLQKKWITQMQSLNRETDRAGKWKILEFMGKHSLFIYLIHQPLLYVICGIMVPPVLNIL